MPTDQYLSQIIVPLLSKPDDLRISAKQDELGTLLSIIVAQEDMGSLIGKEGETAKAIRHLVRILGLKQNTRVSVKILEADGSVRPHRAALAA